MTELELLVQAHESTLVTLQTHNDLLKALVDAIKDLEERVAILEENE